MARRMPALLLLAGSLVMPLAVSSARADDTPLTVFRDSLANNPAWKAAQASAQVDHEGVDVALGQLTPNLSINANKSRANADRTIGNFPGTRFDYDSYDYGINLRQPIFRPYNIAAYQQAGRQSILADSKLEEARNDLVIKTLSAYCDAVFARQTLELLDAQKVSVETQARAAEKSFAAGIGTKIEISEANARRDIIYAQEVEAQNRLDNTLRALRAIVGRPLQSLAPLVPKRMSTQLPRPISLAEWVASAEAGSAELVSARAQVEVAQKEVSKASAGHLPTVDLVAGSSRTSNDSLSSLTVLGDSTYRQNSVGLQVAIPIIGGGVSAQVRQAEAKLEQARMAAEDVQQTIEVKVRNEYGNVVQGAVKVRAQELAETSAAQSVVATKKGMQAGSRSMLDILKSEEQLFTVRRDLAQARYQLIISRIRLLVLAGKFEDDDIAQVSAWFSSAEIR